MRWSRRLIVVVSAAVGLSLSGVALAAPITEMRPQIGCHDDGGPPAVDTSQL